MKILNATEMRKVEGGKSYYCKYCDISYDSWWKRLFCFTTSLHVYGKMIKG